MHAQLVLIVDRSGSMGGKVNDVVGGVNQFISDNKKVEGTAALTIVQFDHLYESKHIEDIQQASAWGQDDYVPRGSTALLDALGRAMNEVGERLQHHPAERVIVCVITDGEENASREFTKSRIKEMIEHAEKHNWSFIYLGADPAAFAEAASIGFRSNLSGTYDNTAKGTQSAYASASYATTVLRSANASAQSINMTDILSKKNEEVQNGQ